MVVVGTNPSVLLLMDCLYIKIVVCIIVAPFKPASDSNEA